MLAAFCADLPEQARVLALELIVIDENDLKKSDGEEADDVDRLGGNHVNSYRVFHAAKEVLPHLHEVESVKRHLDVLREDDFAVLICINEFSIHKEENNGPKLFGLVLDKPRQCVS